MGRGANLTNSPLQNNCRQYVQYEHIFVANTSDPEMCRQYVCRHYVCRQYVPVPAPFLPSILSIQVHPLSQSFLEEEVM